MGYQTVFNRWFLTADIPLSLCIPFHHSTLLVVLSYVVAAFAAYTSFHMIDRVRAAGTVTVRRVWLATAGVSMGLGIWAMHFIAMLAVQIPITIAYDIGITGLSAGCAILASCAGFIILMGNSYERWRLCLAGLVLGGGVGLMHYSGMAALIMPAHIYYGPLAIRFVRRHCRYAIDGRALGGPRPSTTCEESPDIIPSDRVGGHGFCDYLHALYRDARDFLLSGGSCSDGRVIAQLCVNSGRNRRRNPVDSRTCTDLGPLPAQPNTGAGFQTGVDQQSSGLLRDH